MSRNTLVLFLSLLLSAFAACDEKPAKQTSGTTNTTTSTTTTSSQPAASPAASPATTQASAAESSAPGKGKTDPCRLIKNEEVQSVQGSEVREAKKSGTIQGAFNVSQCFYQTQEFSKSVSLSITERDAAQTGRQSPRDYWKESFASGIAAIERKNESRRAQSKETGKPKPDKELPKKVDGIGDEAYWMGSRVGGALYVLKGERFIRISIGGPDTEETKLNKSKTLAQKALERL